MDKTIKTILLEWQDRKFPRIIDREINISSYSKTKIAKIVVITGFRRVGKTYLMLH